MDLVLAPMASHRMTEVDWSSSCVPDQSLMHNSATCTMCGYPTEGLAPVNLQKVDDGLIVPVLETSLYINRLFGVNHKTISDVELDYLRCCSVVNDNGYPSADVLADVFEGLDDLSAQKELLETGGCSFLLVSDHLDFTTSLQWLSKTVQTLLTLHGASFIVSGRFVRLLSMPSRKSSGKSG